jgi:hypothetical protein
VVNDFVKTMFEQMQNQLGRENVYLLFDETNGPVGQPHVKWNDPYGASGGPAIITINEKDCEAINRLHNKGTYAGSMYKVEAQIFACYKAIRRNYDYLWFIEYDVYCKDFNAALRPFDRIKADMLTKASPHRFQTWVRKPWVNVKWFWWDKLEGEISKVPIRRRRGCFFPVNRFSKKFLQVMEQNLSKSTGYCEVYFPTLCRVNDLVLKLIPPGSFGTYRYKPNITAEEVRKIPQQDHRLYHPVKIASL